MTTARHDPPHLPMLKALLDHEIPLWRQFTVRLHLVRCASCREEMRAMQQIGEELRARTIDPLDPGLRSRILATVQEMSPEPALPVQTRRPAWIWAGAAVAALLIVAVFAPSSPFSPRNDEKSAPAAGSQAGSQPRMASAPMSAKQSLVGAAAPESQDRSLRALAAPTAVTKSASDEPAMSEQKSGAAVGSRRQLGKFSFGGSARQRLQPKQTVALERAGFDINGYRFLTLDGKQIEVPFKKSLNAVRFARAADGKMALAKTALAPILYLGPADTLLNDAVPGARWQPLPAGFPSAQPLYVWPTADWAQFTTLRWYPKMTVVGGLVSPAANSASSAWLPGSHVQIGETLYPDFAAFRAYADAHPDALRLHAVYNSPALPAIAPPSPLKAAGSTRGKSRR